MDFNQEGEQEPWEAEDEKTFGHGDHKESTKQGIVQQRRGMLLDRETREWSEEGRHCCGDVLTCRCRPVGTGGGSRESVQSGVYVWRWSRFQVVLRGGGGEVDSRETGGQAKECGKYVTFDLQGDG